MTQRLWLPLLRVELIGVALTFIVFSLFHFSVALGPFADAPLRAGAIAEATLGVLTALAASLTFVLPRSAWGWGVAANAIDTAGVVLGIYATRGGTTELNAIYHRTALAITTLSLVLLLVRGMLAHRHRALR